MQYYLAVIIGFGGNFNPRQFQMCAGQIMAISSNTALFSIIGTYYGGNGTSNFALPDLRGRMAVSQGQGPGLSDYFVGEALGVEATSLLSNNVPSHNHLVNAVAAVGSTNSPANAYFAEGKKTGNPPNQKSPDYYTNGTPTPVMLSPTAVTPQPGGGSNKFSILQPTLAITQIICTQGVFPPRN